MKFWKMHGLGNDFVVVRMQDTEEISAVSSFAKKVCDRYTGIGANGLVLITSPQNADIGMRIFNSDGSESEQCGNAVRCVAKYAYEKLHIQKEQMTVETKRGLQTVWLEVDGGVVHQVKVDMGEPILSPRDIPVVHSNDKMIDVPIMVDHHEVRCTAVSMGNPHAIIEMDDTVFDSIEDWGTRIEIHALFPKRTNVEFMTVHSPHKISLKVWERGVGRTQACGSGACASVVAGVLLGKLDRKVDVKLEGGTLRVYWNEEDNRVYMTGPASFVFEGEIQVPNW